MTGELLLLGMQWAIKLLCQMIKIAKLTPRLMKMHLDYDPRQFDKTMIIYLCTPAPLARFCHYLLIYALIDYRDLRHFQKETFGSETGSTCLPREESSWEKIE